MNTAGFGYRDLVSEEPAAPMQSEDTAVPDDVQQPGEPGGPGAAGEEPASRDKGSEASSGEDGKSPWDDARLPWAGKPGRADVLCWGGIMVSGFYYLALLPFRADLVGTHPLLGTFLNGGLESIVSAASYARVQHGTLVWVLLASIPGLMKFDILYWWAGRLWGERVIHLLSGRRKAGAKAIDRVGRWGRWFTWPTIVFASFIPIPSAIFYVVAGWNGMSAVTFLALDVIGTLLWSGVLAGLGWELGQRGVDVAQTISHYGLWFTIALVVLVVVAQIRSQRAAQRPSR
jgi:membrane protein DedA with SNARE-associated domain